MTTVNERLQDAEIGHAVDLQHLSNAEVRKILKLLNRADVDLRARLIDAIERMGTTTFTVEHMATILASVRALNRQVYDEIGQAFTQSLDDLAVYEINYQQALLTATLPTQALVAVPLAQVSLEQVREIAFRRPFQGRLLREWLSDLEETRAARVRDAIRIGMVEGQTTPQIIQRIMGVRAENYADGLLNRSRQDIEVMVRTAISHVSQGARDAFYAANDDLIDEVEWLSTIDQRTSSDCRLRDKLRYTLNGHKPVGHSVPWGAGPGRIHWQCRSTSTPIIKSWQELGLSADEIDEGTRASMDGQIPASTSYVEWLQRQSAARQDQILGPDRGKLMRQGGLTLEKFYNDKGKYLTLDELKERDARAFEKAGLAA